MHCDRKFPQFFFKFYILFHRIPAFPAWNEKSFCICMGIASASSVTSRNTFFLESSLVVQMYSHSVSPSNIGVIAEKYSKNVSPVGENHSLYVDSELRQISDSIIETNLERPPIMAEDTGVRWIPLKPPNDSYRVRIAKFLLPQYELNICLFSNSLLSFPLFF